MAIGQFFFFSKDGYWKMGGYESVKSKLVEDVCMGIEVSRQTGRGPVKNELDVAFLADNRLYVIECKTRHWRGTGEDGPGAEALYKLDSLKDLLGGLQARAMLVSYRDLPDPDRRRAGDLGIEVCAGGQVKRLMDGLLSRRQSGERIVMVSRQAARLADLLSEQDIPHLQGTPISMEDEMAGTSFDLPRNENDELPAPGSITSRKVKLRMDRPARTPASPKAMCSVSESKRAFRTRSRSVERMVRLVLIF